jgi:CheY-like chemotaxis protein
MEYVAEILKAVASLLWPVLAVVVLIIFRDDIKPIIESARSRRFSVKVGEMELSMEELSKQQSELIKDLQTQVAELQKPAEKDKGRSKKETEPSQPITPTHSILWVDDFPKNNAVLIQNLQEFGIDVATATTTEDALGLIRAVKYDKIVTDMTHPVNGKVETTAGLDLAKIIRGMNLQMPFYIYTSPAKAEKLFDAAQEAGANQITGSATILLALLKGK